MKSTMKRCLAFATVLAMLLSVCALPVFAVDAVKAEPCEHAADVEPETVVFARDEHTHSCYDKYECGECGAKWIKNVVLEEAHDYEDVVTEEATYPVYAIDTETLEPVLVDDGKGVSTPICKVCQHEDTANASEIPALVHSKYEELVNPNGCCKAVVTPATCDEPGSIVYVCDSDGESYFEAEVIDALGHNITVADTCDGEKVVFYCANEGCEEREEVAIYAEAPAHLENCGGTFMAIMGRTGNCVEYAYTLYICVDCEVVYVGDYAVATGHDLHEYEVTAQSCTTDREIVKYCANCVTDVANTKITDDGIWNVADANGNYGLYEKETDTEALKTGHYYMDGETVVVIDPAKCNEDADGNAAVCAGCSENFGHVWVNMETPATCTEDGATWKACACGAEKDYAPVACGHKTVETVTEATLVKDGVKVYTCEVCGEKTADDIILPAAYDIVFNATVANKYGAEALIVNKSVIAYTITLNAAELEVYSVMINVAFDQTGMSYIGYDLGASGANAFGAMTADNAGTTSVGVNNGVATVFAYSANYVDGALAPVVLDGEQVLVTLYFEVDAYANGDYAIGIQNCDVADVAGEHNFDIDVDDEAATSITVAMLGDLAGNDSAITVDDQLVLNALIASSVNDGAALYDARADINQDGEVDFADLYIVNQYLNTTFDYEDFLAGEKLA